MISKKFAIFLDSSFIRGSTSDFIIPVSTEGIVDIFDYIDEKQLKDKVKIIIPEPVMEEMIQQKLRRISSDLSKVSFLKKKYEKLWSIKQSKNNALFNFDYEKTIRTNTED